MGISADSPEKNQSWAEKEGFQFELWTDEERTLALYYGATPNASWPVFSRVTKLLDEEGELVVEYEVTSIGTHPGQVLQDCEALFGD